MDPSKRLWFIRYVHYSFLPLSSPKKPPALDLMYFMRPYDETLIRHSLTPSVNQQLQCISIVDKVDSTNTALLDAARQGETRAYVLLAHEQSAGRGRQGKPWYSPRWGALYLSVLWHFKNNRSIMSGLSLAIGISLCEALEAQGVHSLGLKWPNDLLWDNKKIGGILVESYVDNRGSVHAVIGIGINIGLPQDSDEHIQQPWTDLHSISGKTMDNNQLASEVLNALVPALTLFEEKGLGAFQERWDQYDCLYSRKISLTGLPEPRVGIARGIDAVGGLKIETPEGISVYYSGEVSIGSHSSISS